MTRTALVALLALSACTKEVEPEATPRAVSERTAALAGVVDGNNAFALDLFAAANLAPDENLFLSPFSISSALAMTYAGARGETAAQMERVLHITSPAEVYHAQFGALTRDLDGDLGRPYTLNIANRLFAQDGYPLEADFLAVNEADYGAPLESLDFAGDPEGARGYINGWVADQTADMIDELLKPGVISSSTCLVLTNAIYFKASWANQFDPADTTAGTFHAPAGDVSAQMMSASVEADYAELDDLTVLSLPYEGEDLSFIALLPHDEQGLAALQASLSPETLSAWTDSAWRTEVMVQLPTFELRSSVALKDTLQGLGMIDAFDGLIADFSGIADTGLFISDVAHEAVVIVDEEGTEAAAATAVVDVGTAMPAVFTGDHPFLFIIQDNLTGSILFMGQLNDPTA